MAESTDQKQRIRSLIAIASISLMVGIGIGVVTSLILRNNGTEFSEQREYPTDNLGAEREQAYSTPPSTPTGSHATSLYDFTDQSNFTSHFAWSAALYQFLAGADSDQLHEYLEQTKAIPVRPTRESVENAIVQQLAVIEPEVALAIAEEFGRSQKGMLISRIFQEWSLADLDDAIEQSANLDDQYRRHAILGILYTKQSLSDRELRALARRAGDENVAFEFIARSKIETLRADHESTWNRYVAEYRTELDNLTSEQITLFANLAHTWFEQDGIEVVAKIEDSMNDPRATGSVLNALAAILTRSDHQSALKVALRSPGSLSRFYVWRVAEEWGKSDPKAAIDAALAADSTSLKNSLLDHVLTGWASSDPHGLLSEIAGLPEDIRGPSLEKALVSIAQTEPQSAIAYLGDVSTRKSKNKIAEAIAVNWALQDLAAALAWIRSETRIVNIQSRLVSSVFRELTNVDAEHAFQAAQAQPLEGSNVGIEVQVLSWLPYIDPDLAVSLLEDVERNDETKAEAYNAVVRSLAMNDKPRRAIEVALKFAESGTYKVGYQSIFWDLPIR